MTSTLLRRFGPLLLGGSCCARPDRDREVRRTAHRLSRADHRHLRPGRQGHGRRLQDVSRREEQQVRRRRREVHRRGRAGQAGHRRHQGQEAHPAGQGALLRRRPAGVDRLCARAGQHGRKGRLHLAGVVGGRPHPARPAEVSVFLPHRLVELAAEPSVRAMGLRAGLQEDRHHRRGLCLRLRGRRRLPARVRGLRRADRPEDLAAAHHQGLRALHPDPQGGRGRDLHRHGRPDVAAIPQAAGGDRQQEAGDRRRPEL